MTPAQPKDDQPAPNSSGSEQPRERKPATKESLNGSWKLNIDDSDDGHKKMEAASGSNQNNGPYGGNRGGGLGSPWPGGGGMGGPRTGRNQGEDTTPQVQRLLDPPDSLSFSQKSGEVDLVDSRSRKIAFYTDGRTIEKSKDNDYQELGARWQDVELVSDEKIASNRKITREFEIEPGGERLYETLRIDLRNGSRVNIRYAYDIIPPEDKPRP
jgi:hypothetical protein